jgi:hypothetical protein
MQRPPCNEENWSPWKPEGHLEAWKTLEVRLSQTEYDVLIRFSFFPLGAMYWHMKLHSSKSACAFRRSSLAVCTNYIYVHPTRPAPFRVRRRRFIGVVISEHFHVIQLSHFAVLSSRGFGCDGQVGTCPREAHERRRRGGRSIGDMECTVEIKSRVQDLIVA